MARKRHGKRRRRGTGSIITVRRLSGVNRLNNPSSALGIIGPASIGGGAAILTSIGIRQLVPATPDNAAVIEYADWIGLGVGSVLGLILWNTTGKPAGLAAVVGAGLVTLATKLPGLVAQSGMAAMPAGTSGIGAIVTETVSGLRRRGRMGAVVMQPATPGSYGPGGGESINLHGLSAVRPGAFGTPTFTMGR